jgi:hypothetical protein
MNSAQFRWKFSRPIAIQVSQAPTLSNVPVSSVMAHNNATNGKDNGDDRFRILLWLFKWGASPLVPVEGSWLYNTFCVLLVVCTYLTQVFVVVGILKNLNDVSYIIETVRPLLSMCSVIWMHLFIRYPVSYSF